jgi:glycosyltransferase involved in cell wall biosynthesis
LAGRGWKPSTPDQKESSERILNSSLPISVLLAAKSEELNIRKCLLTLAPAQEIVVIDSQSSDDTTRIAADEFGAKILQFHYSGGYPKKRQWALENFEFGSDWILLLDADEEVPEKLWQEIAAVIGKQDACDGYMIRKGFHFLGRKFRFGGFSHSALVLCRNGKFRFEELVEDVSTGLDMEVHERVIVDGKIDSLETPLVHEDFKGLEAYIDRHNKYSTWEANLRFRNKKNKAYGSKTIQPRLFGNSQERRRFLKQIIVRMPFEPSVWFIYHYIVRLGFLEGRPGFIACRIRASYIAQVRAKLYELSLADKQEWDGV